MIARTRWLAALLLTACGSSSGPSSSAPKPASSPNAMKPASVALVDAPAPSRQVTNFVPDQCRGDYIDLSTHIDNRDCVAPTATREPSRDTASIRVGPSAPPALPSGVTVTVVPDSFELTSQHPAEIAAIVLTNTGASDAILELPFYGGIGAVEVRVLDARGNRIDFVSKCANEGDVVGYPDAAEIRIVLTPKGLARMPFVVERATRRRDSRCNDSYGTLNPGRYKLELHVGMLMRDLVAPLVVR